MKKLVILLVAFVAIISISSSQSYQVVVGDKGAMHHKANILGGFSNHIEVVNTSLISRRLLLDTKFINENNYTLISGYESYIAPRPPFIHHKTKFHLSGVLNDLFNIN